MDSFFMTRSSIRETLTEYSITPTSVFSSGCTSSSFITFVYKNWAAININTVWGMSLPDPSMLYSSTTPSISTIFVICFIAWQFT